MTFKFKVNITDGAYLGKKKVERLLEVPGACTLEDLCISILDAVDFYFDHLYEFSIDGRSYRGAPCSPGRECRTKLYSLNLKKGDTFMLWYDFGDDWEFSIKVEEIGSGQGSGIRLLSQKGSVEQYPDDEYYEDYESEEFRDEIFGEDFEEALYEIDKGMNAFSDDDFDYTPPDELFDAAFRYKKTKLWKKLTGEEPFAIRFSDGTEGIVSIMGMSGEHCAIAVYLEEDGFASYYSLSVPKPDTDRYYKKEQLYMQNCLQLVLDNREYLLDREIENARAYAKKNNVRFSGKNSFPHFTRYSPARYPWHPKGEKEEKYLQETAEAAIALSALIGKNKPGEFGFRMITPFLREVPLMTCENGKWTLSGMRPLPQYKAPVFVQPEPDAQKMAKIIQMRAKDALEARIVMLPSMVRDEEGDAPYFPYCLIAVQKENELLMPPKLIKDLTDDADHIADALLDQLEQLKWRPSKILVEDSRTFAFLSPIADGIGAKLIKMPALDLLDEILDNFMNSVGSYQTGFPEDDEYMDDEPDSFEDLMLMLQAILTLPDSGIREIPRELKDTIREVLDAGIVPMNLAMRVRKKLKLN